MILFHVLAEIVQQTPFVIIISCHMRYMTITYRRPIFIGRYFVIALFGFVGILFVNIRFFTYGICSRLYFSFFVIIIIFITAVINFYWLRVGCTQYIFSITRYLLSKYVIFSNFRSLFVIKLEWPF